MTSYDLPQPTAAATSAMLLVGLPPWLDQWIPWSRCVRVGQSESHGCPGHPGSVTGAHWPCIVQSIEPWRCGVAVHDDEPGGSEVQSGQVKISSWLTNGLVMVNYWFDYGSD